MSLRPEFNVLKLLSLMQLNAKKVNYLFHVKLLAPCHENKTL